MSTPSEPPPRRRFAPVPIETTFEQFRKPGPAPELTPEPSPRSASPAPPRDQRLRADSAASSSSSAAATAGSRPDKRRFAPQLVESSRRSRRTGDVGPATRPTDKTDITPYTNHIYSLSRARSTTKARHAKTPSMGRRESCDDEVAGHVFDLVARDAEKKLQEVMLSAFPNAGARAGGAEHFFVREGSEDDDGAQGAAKAKVRGPGPKKPTKRWSSEEDVSWAVKEAQEHHDQLAKDRQDRVATPELDKMDIDSPPDDVLWTTRRRGSTMGSLGPIGEAHMPFIPEEPQSKAEEVAKPAVSSQSPPARAIGESHMPYIPSAPAGKAADVPYSPPTSNRIPPETGFANRGPFGRPLGHLRGSRNFDRERELHQLRSRASPPLLGRELKFRRCPSPKVTKLEPEHPWDKVTGALEDPNRDITGQNGLWRGYCYTADKRTALAPVERPALLHTPLPPPSPGDPFASAFATAPGLSEDATPLNGSGGGSDSNGSGMSLPATLAVPEHRSRWQPKGLHMLQGLDERLRKEKAAADLDEVIAAEFDDHFVSQVYNYLSLGYPATARPYDDELSRISRISVTVLEADDDIILNGLAASSRKRGGARGNIKLEASMDAPEEQRCPRWKALKLYIYEWARQHPNLHDITPLAWGVMERRGSWAL